MKRFNEDVLDASMARGVDTKSALKSLKSKAVVSVGKSNAALSHLSSKKICLTEMRSILAEFELPIHFTKEVVLQIKMTLR